MPRRPGPFAPDDLGDQGAGFGQLLPTVVPGDSRIVRGIMQSLQSQGFLEAQSNRALGGLGGAFAKLGQGLRKGAEERQQQALRQEVIGLTGLDGPTNEPFAADTGEVAGVRDIRQTDLTSSFEPVGEPGGVINELNKLKAARTQGKISEQQFVAELARKEIAMINANPTQANFISAEFKKNFGFSPRARLVKQRLRGPEKSPQEKGLEALIQESAELGISPDTLQAIKRKGVEDELEQTRLDLEISRGKAQGAELGTFYTGDASKIASEFILRHGAQVRKGGDPDSGQSKAEATQAMEAWRNLSIQRVLGNQNLDANAKQGALKAINDAADRSIKTLTGLIDSGALKTVAKEQADGFEALAKARGIKAFPDITAVRQVGGDAGVSAYLEGHKLLEQSKLSAAQVGQLNPKAKFALDVVEKLQLDSHKEMNARATGQTAPARVEGTPEERAVADANVGLQTAGNRHATKDQKKAGVDMALDNLEGKDALKAIATRPEVQRIITTNDNLRAKTRNLVVSELAASMRELKDAVDVGMLQGIEVGEDGRFTPTTTDEGTLTDPTEVGTGFFSDLAEAQLNEAREGLAAQGAAPVNTLNQVLDLMEAMPEVFDVKDINEFKAMIVDRVHGRDEEAKLEPLEEISDLPDVVEESVSVTFEGLIREFQQEEPQELPEGEDLQATAGRTVLKKPSQKATEGASGFLFHTGQGTNSSDRALSRGIMRISPGANPSIVKGLIAGRDVLYANGIRTNKELAMFLAQMAHETANFRTLREYASGKAYNGRRDLGNTRPGDGPRYKGRGYIQLTGRANYRTYGKIVGADLESNPELAARPDIALKVALAYWKRRGLGKLARRGDIRGVTKRINGGFNGLRDRTRKYQRFLKLLKD